MSLDFGPLSTSTPDMCTLDITVMSSLWTYPQYIMYRKLSVDGSRIKPPVLWIPPPPLQVILFLIPLACHTQTSQYFYILTPTLNTIFIFIFPPYHIYKFLPTMNVGQIRSRDSDVLTVQLVQDAITDSIFFSHSC